MFGSESELLRECGMAALDKMPNVKSGFVLFVVRVAVSSC